MDHPCDAAELPIAALVDAVQHQLEAHKLVRYAHARARGHLRACDRCRTVLVWSVLQLIRETYVDAP